ncbi:MULTISPECIES: hypothetical protein [Pseudomonas]|uniref:hypothetical protein n=1 Tax=Pseudomonas TaxID=286 RepID=UPI00070922C2|nr:MULTISPECIES: hypothetical protein [Pseudomonas]KQW19706.1 hypothetical protein ASC85_07585 [Pseudomonas sp. Root401]WHS57615.1 hypothetical protein QLH64_30140 [Pseudomonas brassicacearum]
MNVKQIENWMMVPTTGNTISLFGDVGGTRIQTSPIKFGKPGEVETQNSVYKLGKKSPGLWELKLAILRRSQMDELIDAGAL